MRGPIVTLSFLLALQAHQAKIAAQETPSARPPAEAPVLTPHPRTGAQGLWLDLSVAREALVCLQNLPRSAEHVRVLNESLRLAETELRAARTALTSSENELSILRAQLVRTERSLATAHDDLGAWYRSPVLWFVAGALLATGVSLALALSV